MSKQLNNIDQLFQDKLYDYDTPAPADVWSKINNSLERKQKRMWLGIAMGMAASLALIISAGIGYYLGSEKNTSLAEFNKPVTIKNVAKTEEPTQINTVSANKPLIVRKPEINPELIENIGLAENSYKKADSKGLSSNNNNFSNLLNSTGSKNIDVNSNNKALQAVSLNTNTSDLETQQLLNSNNLGYLQARTVEKLPNEPIRRLAVSNAHINNYFASLNNEPEYYNEPEVEKKPLPLNWEMGANVAPTYAYRNISENNTVYATNTLNNNVKPLATYSGGVNVQVAKGRWRFETGVSVSNMGQKIENLHVADLAMVNNTSYYMVNKSADYHLERQSPGNTALNSSGTIKLNSEGQAILLANGYVQNRLDSKNSWGGEVLAGNESSNPEMAVGQYYKYIEVPLIAHYKIIDKWFGLGVSGGLSTNILTDNSLEVNINGKKENAGEMLNVEKYNYAGLAGISLELPLVSKLVFRLEPRFRYYINPLARDPQVSVHPYSFGVYSGISYKF